MHARAALAYKKVFVTSAPPTRILDELYVRLLADLEAAEAAILAGDVRAKGTHTSRALAILAELTAALDPRAAPELAENLARLYAFASRRISEGSAKLEAAALAEARGVLTPIHEAFRQIVQVTP